MAGESQVDYQGEEGEEGAYDGPAFELHVFREAWRCLILCWDPQVSASFVTTDVRLCTFSSWIHFDSGHDWPYETK